MSLLWYGFVLLLECHDCPYEHASSKNPPVCDLLSYRMGNRQYKEPLFHTTRIGHTCQSRL